MPFSENTTRELRHELVDLKRTRATLDARIIAIQAVLAFDERGHRTRAKLPPLQQLKKFQANQGSGRRGRARAKKVPLRVTVSAVLERTPGLRASEVAAALRDAGLSLGGKSTLYARVSRELYRLTKKGVLQRNESGGYVLVGGNSVAEAQ